MRRASVAAFAAVVVAMLGAAAITADVISVPRFDSALIDLATREAADGERLLGPYSRFGWHHPGPALFYVLVPFFHLNESAQGLEVGGLAISLASALGIVVAVRCWSGEHAARLAALVTAVFVIRLGPGVAWGTWNAYIVTVPLSLAFVLSAYSQYSAVALAWTAVAVSFCVQTNISVVPVAAVVALFGVSGWLVPRVQRARATPGGRAARTFAAQVREELSARARLAVGLAVAITAIMWVPVIVEETQAEPGNLSDLTSFFTESGAAFHDPAEAGTATLRQISEPLFGGDGGEAAAPPKAPWRMSARSVVGGLAVLLAALASVFWSSRPAWNPARHLGFLSVTAVIISIWGGTRVQGPLLFHVSVWQRAITGAVMIGSAIAVAAWLAGRPAAFRRGAAVAAVLAMALATAADLPAWVNRFRAQPENVEALDMAGEIMAAAGDGPLWLDIQHDDSWGDGALLAVALTRSGADYAISARWEFMFGPDKVAPPAGRTRVVLTHEGARPAGPGARRVGALHASSIWVHDRLPA